MGLVLGFSRDGTAFRRRLSAGHDDRRALLAEAEAGRPADVAVAGGDNDRLAFQS
jgi:hypothetical protein